MKKCQAHPHAEVFLVNGKVMCVLCVESNKDRLPWEWSEIQRLLHEQTLRKGK